MKFRTWLVLAGLFFTGCTRTAITLPAPATLQPLHVFHPPVLRWMAPEMARCAQETPGLALYRTEIAEPKAVRHDEVLFWWGSVPDGKHIYQIGEDSLQVVVHADRAGITFSTNELSALFEGRETHWPDGAPVQVWVYPASDPLWQTFAVALDISAPASDAFLAPDPQAMLEAIAEQPDAIGLLPASWSNEKQPVAIVKLNEALASALRQPILALLPDDPQGASRSWMICIQSPNP